MADLIAVQCPRCEHQTVAGHRDCLVCGRTIHPEVDPRTQIHFCMKIEGREIIFFHDQGPRRAFWLLLIPFIGFPAFFSMRDFDFASVSPWVWAAIAFGSLAIAVVVWKLFQTRKPNPRQNVLLVLDGDGILFPRCDDTRIRWADIEMTKGSGSPYPNVSLGQFGQLGADISFRVKRDLDIDPVKYSGLNYNPLSRTVTLANVSIDPEFVCRAVAFFGPILTQER